MHTINNLNIKQKHNKKWKTKYQIDTIKYQKFISSNQKSKSSNQEIKPKGIKPKKTSKWPRWKMPKWPKWKVPRWTRWKLN